MRLSCLWACLLLAGAGVAVADELEDAYENLKRFEEEKDVAQVKRLAAETHALAVKALSEPAPADKEEKESWTKRMAYVKEIDLHAEYALYALATQSEGQVTIDLITALEKQNPKSKYLDLGYGQYFVALGQTGSASKIPAIAEKVLGNFPENEDALAILADSAFSAQQLGRAAGFANRLTNVLNKHAKPETVSAEDWARYRGQRLARGYWIAGIAHAADERTFAAANRELRSALPLIKGNSAMEGPALFYLGVVNCQLGQRTLNKQQVLESVKFSSAAAAIPGPYVQNAWTNVNACTTAAGKMR